MSDMSYSEELLSKLHLRRPKSFVQKLDAIQTGTGFVLAYLDASNGEVVAGDLARELHVSTARVAALLNKMEKNGLIMRNPSPEDARKTVVDITHAGRIYLSEHRKDVLSVIDRLVEKVGREDMEEFVRISEEISRALEEIEKEGNKTSCLN